MTVRISNPYYASYSKGIITTFSEITEKMQPIKVDISYVAPYETMDESGRYVKDYFVKEHTINLFIYEPLEGVEVTSPKAVDMYLERSLGHYSKDLSMHTIMSTFLPNRNDLGAEWNTVSEGNWSPVELMFDYETQLNEKIVDENGNPIYFSSTDASVEPRYVYYRDLFEVDAKNEQCVCIVNNRLIADDSDETLLGWLQKYGDATSTDQINSALRNIIYRNKIEFVINIYINQFDKLQNINSVKISSFFAERVGEISLDVEEDGVYFESRNSTIDKENYVIEYTIDNDLAVNKDLFIGYYETINGKQELLEYQKSVYDISIKASTTKNSGRIIVTPDASVSNINKTMNVVVTTKDNISTAKKVNNYDVYDLYSSSTNLLRSFRITTADGSENSPFEIRNVTDYKELVSDVNSGNYFHYVLTRDLNLSGHESEVLGLVVSKDNAKDKLKTFSLSGAHSFVKNNQEIVTYNTIYNLNVNKNITGNAQDVHFGLFDYVDDYALFSNITIEGFNVVVNIDESVPNVNVGLLVGKSAGAKIYNCSVAGNINVIRNDGNADISVGGMIGYATNNTIISGVPGKYKAGISISPENANVSIDIAGKNNVGETEISSVSNNIIGGLVGTINNSRILDSEVVSLITSTVRATIGGVVGSVLANGTVELNSIVVSPKIVVNINENIDNGDDLIIGGVLGSTNDTQGYALNNVSMHFVDIGEGYSWTQKANVFVSAVSSQVLFGGLVGLENAGGTISYSYIRNFYNAKISDEKINSYRGNIYILANSGVVGGLVGKNISGVTIYKSYFDADIIASDVMNKGMIVGLLDNSKTINISNSYGIGYLINHSFKETQANSGIYVDSFKLVDVQNDVADGMWTIDGAKYNDGKYNISGVTQSYAVVNSDKTYVANAGYQYIYDTSTITTVENVFNEKGFNITSGTASINSFDWFIHSDFNTITIGTGESQINIAYPLILKDGVAMYDIVPESISVTINPKDDLYNISYTKLNDSNEEVTYVQVLMYLKRSLTGQNDSNFYQMSITNEPVPHFHLKLNGALGDDSVYSSILKGGAGDRLEYIEGSNGQVIKIVGNRVYPVAPGLATLTIRSYVSKSVKTTISIVVVDGLDDFNVVMDNEGSNKVTILEDSNTDSMVNNETLYDIFIDEKTKYTILGLNDKKLVNGVYGSKYIANSHFGIIIELLDATKSAVVDGDGNVLEPARQNGVFKIGDQEFIYDSEVAYNNIIQIDSRDFQLSGISHGYVKFAITPYLLLDDNEYEDTYTSVVDSGVEYEFDNNVFVLDDLQKVYSFEVRARARGMEVTKTVVEIDALNTVPFGVILETANILIEDLNNGTAKITILEDIYVKINGNKYSSRLSLRGKEFICDVIDADNGIYECSNITYEFDYALINIIFDNIYITKTNIDAQSRLNTYKISIDGVVSFDGEYYRRHANMFDLNTTSFNVQFVAETNSTKSSAIVVKIVPKTIEEIFVNFYTSGENALTNNGTDIEYPEENESSFVVPGRAGLLKITLDEEFNNSSYITITLNKQYKDYVTLTQLEAVIAGLEASDNILGYSEVVSYDIIDTDNVYGLRLAKQSINYSTENYFNNTYFVKVYVEKGISLSTLNMTINSYMVDSSNKVVKQDVYYDCQLTIAELTDIKVTLDGEQKTIMGKGVRKALNITYNKNLAQDIQFRITEILNGQPTQNSDKTIDYVYIADETGQKVNYIDIDDLKDSQNKKTYYLCQDVATAVGSEFSITFTATDIIMGVVEKTTCELLFDTVDFEVEDVLFAGAVDGVIVIPHGASSRLDTSSEESPMIKIKDVVIGDSVEIADYVKSLYVEDTKNGLMGAVIAAQYGMAGTAVTANKVVDGNVENVTYSYDANHLYYRVGVDDDNQPIYEKMSNGVYDGITLSQDVKQVDNIKYFFYEVKGSAIGDSTRIQLDVDYCYEDGKFSIGNNAKVVYTIIKNLQIVVKDNSTYDHPTPIEDQAQLLKYCGVDGNYILLNDITLVNWVPQKALFSSLDGNGYVIKIQSFDLSGFRGKTNQNVGIFSEISENTLLKNITIDVSDLLISELKMSDNISYMKASTKNSYVYKTEGVDLGYSNGVNFGILAGKNNGAITNAKIISTKDTSDKSVSTNKYLHIQTTLGFEGDNLYVSNIGGIVGVNSVTGAITNSFVGVNISNEDNGEYYITNVNVSDKSGEQNNEYDELQETRIYPFVLAGGTNIGGIACTNEGTISNVYNKGMGVYNPYPKVENSATAGLVTYNKSGLMTSTFVESVKFNADGKAYDDEFRIESTGCVGGLVYENNAKIENSYVNASLQTLSSFLGGFVFKNTSAAVVSNSYVTTLAKITSTTGQFTGIIDDVVQNEGTYNNCYYTINTENGEFANINEKAVAIDSKTNPFDQTITWKGFSFVFGKTEGGIWSVEEGGMPKLATTLTDTISFRKLTNIQRDVDGQTGVRYDYEYDNRAYLGTKQNPLIVEKAENFAKYIIDNSYSYDGNPYNMAFGYRSGEDSTRFVRIVNNLDFTDESTANVYNKTYLYMISFCGVLDGNGMSFTNLNIETDTNGLKNFGLFAQIGHENTSSNAVVKNLNISVASYSSGGDKTERAGILAGTIVNANIVNVDIDGGNNNIFAAYMVGGLAGLVYSTNGSPLTINDVDIKDVHIAAVHNSLGGSITAMSEDMSEYFLNSFSLLEDGVQSENGYSFNSLYDSSNKKTLITGLNGVEQGKGYENKVSYVGGVAGVIVANNYNREVTMEQSAYENYRTKTDESTINNIVVQGEIYISTAENAGGLFGYIGENTLIKNSKFIVSQGQLLKASNNSGGIVGEHHGILEQCTIAYSDEEQAEYDSTIVGNKTTNGDYFLFDLDSDQGTFYTVSIGGIAGYSENGVIIDSYAKINVTKELAFVAGGIVGYSRGNNYLGFVYHTGTVFAQDIIGGIIGFQVNDYGSNQITNRLFMDNVVSLANWNDSSELNFRNEVTIRLYNNTKFLYSNGEAYYNYYFKLPEVGNAQIQFKEDITKTENDTTKVLLSVTDAETRYRNTHNKYYIGSVIGKALLKSGYNKFYDGDVSTPNYQVFANQDILTDLYSSATKNVFSTTLGVIDSSEGSIESGKRYDDYFKQLIDISDSGETSLKSYSYRIAYSATNGVDEDRLNVYEMKTTTTNNSDYLDRFSYAQTFTAQEYVEQILGSAYKIDGVNSITTRNIFTSGYNVGDRFKTASGDSGQFVISAAVNADGNTINIWDVEDLLPTYSTDIDKAVQNIDSAESLSHAFMNGVAGQVFRINKNISLDISSTSKYIEYFGGVKASFVGVDTDESQEGIQKPKITITLNDGSSVATIFNMFTGALLQSIDFDIQVNKTDFTNAKIDMESYGILANTLESVYINDCKFTIALDSSFIADCKLTDKVFKAKNVGVLFGSINNSTLINSEFDISVLGVVIIENEKIENFGIFAGQMNSTTFDSCAVDIAVNGTLFTNSAETMNFGGVAGALNNSKFHISAMDLGTISIVDNESNEVDGDKIIKAYTRNIGGMFGYAKNSNIVGNVVEQQIENKKINIEYQANYSIEKVNIANVIGQSSGSKVNDYIASSDSGVVVTSSATATINAVNVASIIGYDKGYSAVGSNGVVGSYSKIDTTGIQTLNLAVGGIVGASTNSNNLMQNTFFDGELTIENTQTGIQKSTQVFDEKGNPVKDSNGNIQYNTVYTSANTYIGSVLGFAEGGVSIENTIGAGTIDLKNIAVHSETSPVLVGIGGLVGGSAQRLELNNFVAITEINNNSGNDFKTMYISGILGYNAGVFDATEGYSYVQLPKLQSGVTSAITDGSVTSDCTNVMYAQEFVGNNYKMDTCFETFAFGDLFKTVSEYSPIFDLIRYDKEFKKNITLESEKDYIDTGLTLEDIGNIQLIIPEKLSGYITRHSSGSGATKFDLFEYTNGSTLATNYKFIALSDDADKDGEVTLSTIGTLNADQYISGRSIKTGKVSIKFGTPGALNHFVKTNNGVISNLYINAGQNTSSKIALTETNVGLITNCYIYGLNENKYQLANTNNGRIYSSASAVKFVCQSTNPDENVLYGLVYANNGVISDCYSASYGYTENSSYITVLYGLAFSNNENAIIENSTYYVPSAMLTDNVDKGPFDRENVSNCKGKYENSYDEKLPKKLLERKTVWYDENSHVQIQGFKDIAGSMTIKLFFKADENSSVEAIKDVADLKAKIQASIESQKGKYPDGYLLDGSNNFILNGQGEKIRANSEYELSYKYEFYSTEQLKYNVVRICNGEAFIEYVNSLSNGVIPKGTIVVLTNDASKSSDSHILSVDATLISNSLILTTESALVGINSVSTEQNITIDFIKSNEKTQLTHSFVETNNGLISRLSITNVLIRKIGNNSAYYFGPIVSNYGIIDGFGADQITVQGSNALYITGLVTANATGSYMANCTLGAVTLSTTIGSYNYITNSYAEFMYNNRCDHTAISVFGGTYCAGDNRY